MATYFVSNAGSNTAPYDTEAKAATTLDTIEAVPWAAGDIVKISSTHTETAGVALAYVFPTTPGLQILSVTFNGSGTGALTAGAAINVGAANAGISLTSGFAYCYGVNFTSGTNNNVNCNLLFANGSVSAFQKFESCTFSVPSVNAGAQIAFGPQASSSLDDIQLEFVNCTFSNGANKSLSIRSGRHFIDNMTIAGTAPTSLFATSAAGPHHLTVRASDLSGVAWTNLINVNSSTASTDKFIQCKLVSGFTISTGTLLGPGSPIVEIIDCNSGDVHYYYTKQDYNGTVIADNSVYYDASDGTNSISWLMTASANASFSSPLESPPISWFNSTLSAMTTTVEVTNDGTTYKDNELWQETLSKVTSGFPTGTWNRGDRAADILAAGSNQESSSVSWTGTGGFVSEIKQKLVSTSFTPAEVGFIVVVVKLAKASDNAYVSPKVLASSAKQYMALCGTYINEQPAAAGGGTRAYGSA